MAASFLRLVDIMKQLRTPETGCPWDVEQTFETIAPYTIEEAYEVADAIERGDMTDLRDELGDLLLQVVFHGRIAEESDLFHVGDVADAISDKMIRRHPHVFADQIIEDAEAQTASWEDTKARERAEKAARTGQEEDTSVLANLPVALPALTRAFKLQKRAARVGFDWADARLVIDKFREELDELDEELARAQRQPDRIEDEVGDLLFTCVNVARQLGIDPETALRHGNAKFERRFRQLETDVAAKGNQPQDMSLDALEDAWGAAKRVVG
ncbi:MAG: nucleoside triphosphate pyrophosphohydrolase [Rhodospirillales bacterium]|nr:nucleoside triphosphate pyrophosphohydrolase [Rhodospirillales bacterium]MBT4625810.1 nucleoside triphosphate pyrophosphohydrolase [Rhodospirillales bacterium]MBT5351682.1 nucleoside triphosphate pyrophosphohydrolase [Rhodospirillales bacterium]MBT5519196.1 nucleoside triphosphate pyrophosphohydrolase [Rhodospirillales bacterium]MBT6110023.1 nucleoside triphosphate pyrophosphohydrolase [Rhodospirillales bacterium]